MGYHGLQWVTMGYYGLLCVMNHGLFVVENNGVSWVVMVVIVLFMLSHENGALKLPFCGGKLE